MTENAANLELAADIVSAYVSNNSLPALEIPAFIHSVHGALVGLATGQVIPNLKERDSVAVLESATI
jgi:predicted transcriptional regulator